MDWYVHAKLGVGLDDSRVDDLLDALEPYAGVAAPGSDSLGLSFTVTADDVAGAYSAALAVLDELAPLTGGADVTHLELKTEAEMNAELAEPTIPDLVGLKEIAEMADVSTQRANTLVKQAGFPEPIVELSAGRFRLRAAVEQWLSTWERSPGRKTGGRAMDGR